ncbi:hypothetical protein CTAYLR_002054 [Chrysophaeum taylorii]|uniref:tRNA N(3)-methylcytidine methyltransferase n=1 Tax=Chrysophaeum taylorii TaxID=2483200 RepID=A0AAD7UMM5_9STRA|nr:hypothetical protein CTAYLR_002054 [Chrysophaeum taylorii]
MCEELAVLAALYRALQIKKTRLGPPSRMADDGVWARDAWDEAQTHEAAVVVSRQGPYLSEFWVREHERRSRKSWDAFYRRHGTTAYRDRRYVDVVFADALAQAADGTLVELGCGVGNGVAAVAARRLVCLDFSPRAVTMVRERLKDCVARVCDVVADPLGEPDASVACVSCLFVLSALNPDCLPDVVRKITNVLRPGGYVIVRDYGRYDAAQLRFAKGRRLADHWYVKSDGTRCYYFATGDLDALFECTTFEGRATYECQAHKNRATRELRRRVFVQAAYRKL